MCCFYTVKRATDEMNCRIQVQDVKIYRLNCSKSTAENVWLCTYLDIY